MTVAGRAPPPASAVPAPARQDPAARGVLVRLCASGLPWNSGPGSGEGRRPWAWLRAGLRVAGSRPSSGVPRPHRPLLRCGEMNVQRGGLRATWWTKTRGQLGLWTPDMATGPCREAQGQAPWVSGCGDPRGPHPLSAPSSPRPTLTPSSSQGPGSWWPWPPRVATCRSRAIGLRPPLCTWLLRAQPWLSAPSESWMESAGQCGSCTETRDAQGASCSKVRRWPLGVGTALAVGLTRRLPTARGARGPVDVVVGDTDYRGFAVLYLERARQLSVKLYGTSWGPGSRVCCARRAVGWAGWALSSLPPAPALQPKCGDRTGRGSGGAGVRSQPEAHSPAPRAPCRPLPRGCPGARVSCTQSARSL
uniref:Uncharacterized protein n=1 Tax=Bos mutus grunniens TaxID=30521 RepID=A0A8C0A815_BOSMU